MLSSFKNDLQIWLLLKRWDRSLSLKNLIMIIVLNQYILFLERNQPHKYKVKTFHIDITSEDSQKGVNILRINQ